MRVAKWKGGSVLNGYWPDYGLEGFCIICFNDLWIRRETVLETATVRCQWWLNHHKGDNDVRACDEHLADVSAALLRLDGVG